MKLFSTLTTALELFSARILLISCHREYNQDSIADTRCVCMSETNQIANFSSVSLVFYKLQAEYRILLLSER